MIAPLLTLLLAAAPATPPPENLFTSPVGKALTSHMNKGMADAAVGQWVTYRLDGGFGRVSFWRIAIVGEEVDVRGRPAFWVEMEHGEHHAMKAPLAQMRMLVTRDLGFTKDGVTRVFAATGVNRPAELAPEGVALMMSDPPPPPAQRPTPMPAKMEGVNLHEGKESSLVTLAGTVSAIPIELRLRSTVVKRMWMSRQIPIFHLARVEIPVIENSMEVRDYGTDARPMMVLPPKDAPKVKPVPYNEVVKESEEDSP